MASVTRISGMVSGLDTDTLVKKMMAAESIKLTKMKQNQEKYTWQSDGYRQWNTDLFAFRSNTLFNMKLSSTYNTLSTTSSNPDSMSGTATADAVAGTYGYQVSNLAQSATIKSNIAIDQEVALGTDAVLVLKAKDQTGASYSTEVKVAAGDKIGDVIAKLNTAKDNTTGNMNSGKSMGLKAIYDSTLKQFILKTKDTGANTEISIAAKKINADGSTSTTADTTFLETTLGFSASPDNIANGFSGASGTTYVTAKATYATRVPDTNLATNPNYVAGNTGLLDMSAAGATTGAQIKVGNQIFNLETALSVDWTIGPKTMTDVASALKNATSSNGTKLSDLVDITTIVTGADTNLSFKAKSTEANSIVISAGTGTLKNAIANLFSIDTAANAAIDLGDGKIVGISNPNVAQDAKINFNGTDVASATNTIKVLGVNFTLKNITTAPQTVTIASDMDAEVKNIKDFVTKYNEMLDKLNTAINETVYKDFLPLTDEQREAMSETQITAWEKKAKSGLLHNDSNLKQLISSMRNHMTTAVDNGSDYNSLASIGIASKSYADKGKLYIDETKLRAALQADPEAVKNLFSQSPSDATTNVKKGLVVRLYDDFQTAFTKIKDKAGSAGSNQYDQSVIGKLMSKTYKDINSETDRLSKKESNYYKRFTAMETALNNYNSQSSYLSQSLSSSSG